MLLEEINRFWKAGLMEKNKKTPLFAMIILIMPSMKLIIFSFCFS